MASLVIRIVKKGKKTVYRFNGKDYKNFNKAVKAKAKYDNEQNRIKRAKNSALESYEKSTNDLYKMVNQMEANQKQYLQQAQSAQDMNYKWNAEQAQLNRDFQMEMSANAHQREVADLKAAGLSPVLSANAGAPVTSGATASAANDMTAAFSSMASSALKAMTEMMQSINKNNTDVVNTIINSNTSQFGSVLSKEATQYASDQSYMASKYAADLSAKTNLTIAQANNMVSKYVAEIQSLTQKQVAAIAAEAGVSVAKVNQATSNYSADMAYKAAVKTANIGANKSLEGHAVGWLSKVEDVIINKIGWSKSDFTKAAGAALLGPVLGSSVDKAF